jgi:drug/metabolite transporter (DMT)-like permease
MPSFKKSQIHRAVPMMDPVNYQPQYQPWQGVLWKLISCACFAGLNIVVSYLTKKMGAHNLDPSVVPFWQNLFGCLFFMPYILTQWSKIQRPDHLWLHGGRIFFGLLGMVCLYFAFRAMPVAQAVALGFLSPIFTVLGAHFYLKEPLGSLRIGAIIVGFVGAFIILRPDRAFYDSQWDSALIYPLASGIAFALSKVMGRKLSLKGASANLLTVYLLVFMVPLSFIFAQVRWSWPVGSQWLLCMALGALASGAHYSLAKSFALADISFLTPFGAARLFFSAILAYFFFGEYSQEPLFWMGSLLIILSTIFMGYTERKKK